MQIARIGTICRGAKIFFSKKCHPSRRILRVENFRLQFFFFCRIARIGTFYRGAKNFFFKKCHPSRGILKVENFPLQKKKILQNCKNWNILQRELFFEKSEIFPLFPLTRKFRKFIYPGLYVYKVSAKNIF